MIFMNSSESWKCPFCGANVNPGDQVCMHCGEAIHNTNVTISDLRSHENSGLNQKKKNKWFLVFTIFSVFVCILVIFSIVWFGILKR